MSTVFELTEYQSDLLELPLEDIDFLRHEGSNRFSLSRPLSGAGVVVNPNQYVGVITLPSGNRLVVNPKVPIANLAWMIAVVTDLADFYEESAPFDRIDDLLEHVVAYFVGLVEHRIDHGLYRSYLQRGENLLVIRGRIDFAQDVRTNHALRHRTYCDYSELSWDVPENQIILQVVRMLAGWGFRRGTTNRLRAVETAMADVTLTTMPPTAIDRLRYNRFNDDYEQIHRLCRLFMEGASLSAELGSFDARTFLVNMNTLFEQFVTRLLQDSSPSGVRVHGHRRTYLVREHTITIDPDVVLLSDSRTIAVADCKYKQTSPNAFKNHDVYQVLAYCTALGTTTGLLLYPRHELPVEQAASIVRSTVQIEQMTLDLGVSPAQFQRECANFTHLVFDRAVAAVPEVAVAAQTPVSAV